MKLFFLLLIPFLLGYAMGVTRSSDHIPREVYGKDGRRIL